MCNILADDYSLINILAWVREGSRGTGSLEFRACELHAPYLSADLRVLLEFLEPWGIFPAEKIAGFSSVLFSKGAVKWDNNDSVSTVSTLSHSGKFHLLLQTWAHFLSPKARDFWALLSLSRDLLQHDFALAFTSGKKKCNLKPKKERCWTIKILQCTNVAMECWNGKKSQRCPMLFVPKIFFVFGRRNMQEVKPVYNMTAQF